jgi:long-chain acyl-CoA synthetase
VEAEKAMEVIRDTTSAIPSSCDTVARLFRHAAAARGERVAMMHKHLGIWQPVTWRDYGERARWTGLGLDALGLRPREAAGVLAETIPEWLFTDMGIIGTGAISVGLCATSSPEQVEYLVNDSGARFLFVGDEEQLDKVLERRNGMQGLVRVIVYDMTGLKRFQDPLVMSYADLLSLGQTAEAKGPEGRGGAVEAVQPEDPAIIVYTSGTSGPPKGAIISHRNLIFAIDRWGEVAPTVDADDTLAFLPLCHIAERMMTSMRPLAYGGVVHFAESPDTVQENLREVSPTVFFAVPRIWEKGHSTVTMALQDATTLQRAVFRIANRVGHAVADRRAARMAVPLWLRALYVLAELVVLRKTRRLLGLSRARLIGSGAAPISPAIMRWYAALGIPIFEMYGQTECTGIATFSRAEECALGTVGRPLSGTEVRLAPDQEILIRGEHVFQGYLNKPERTAEAIRDGWLHTGDLGAITPEGRLRITGRKSDIIVTSSGTNITPSEIENRLKGSPYISDVVVIGDGRSYLTALLLIDLENVTRYAQASRIPFSDYASLARAPAIRDLVWGEVEKVNRQVADGERIRKIHLLDILLDAEDEQMTPTLKLRRKVVCQKYAREIEAMYGG